MSDNIYLGNNLGIKTIYLAITGFIDTVLAGTAALVFPLTMIDYSSAALGFFLCLAIAFGILAFLRVKSLLLIFAAKSFSQVFMKSNEPFIIISRIQIPKMRKWK